LADKREKVLDEALDEAMRDATITMESVGGRTLRVATWRLDQPSEHLPILFFNGIGANIEAVAPLAEALPDRAFIMFDMPGIGGSPEPVVPYNTVTMAWTTTQLLDKLGVDKVDLMGVSWGGAMAQHFAIQHPGRTRRLILAATTAGMIMMPGNPASLSKGGSAPLYRFCFYGRALPDAVRRGIGQGDEQDGAHPSVKAPFPARIFLPIDGNAWLDQRARFTVHA